MAIITCKECGKEFSDKAAACPNCGCPTSENFAPDTCDVDAVKEEKSSWNPFKDRYKATKKYGPVRIDEVHKVFQIDGIAPATEKKSGLIGKSFKGLMAVSTMGMSVAAGKMMSSATNKFYSSQWHDFSSLINYELLEDDSSVTSGGIGQALIGGALFGGVGAAVGGITAKRITKKKIESLYIKITFNDFSNPCLMIPLITKPTKTNSKDYQNAFEQAQQILAILDVITHQK